jgi:hypothetical protein
MSLLSKVSLNNSVAHIGQVYWNSQWIRGDCFSARMTSSNKCSDHDSTLLFTIKKRAIILDFKNNLNFAHHLVVSFDSVVVDVVGTHVQQLFFGLLDQSPFQILCLFLQRSGQVCVKTSVLVMSPV